MTPTKLQDKEEKEKEQRKNACQKQIANQQVINDARRNIAGVLQEIPTTRARGNVSTDDLESDDLDDEQREDEITTANAGGELTVVCSLNVTTV